MVKDLGEFNKAQDTDLHFFYNLNEGRFNNLQEYPTFDVPAPTRSSNRVRRRAQPGLGASSVRSILPVMGSRSIRGEYHQFVEDLAVSH